MRRVLHSIAACFTALTLAMSSGSIRSLGAQGAGNDAAFVRASYTKREVRIPMRDGVQLFTTIYTPRDAARENRYPILLLRTPFSVRPYGADKFPATLGPDRYMLREKYIFVYQDVRGRYMSEGEFVNARPLLTPTVNPGRTAGVDEATDAYDTIDWLVNHVPNNNGRVGQWGISYPGLYATEGLISHHPALVASSPQAPLTDLFFEDFHHNGALTQAYFYAYPIFGVHRDEPTADDWWSTQFEALARNDASDDYAYQLSLGPISTFATRFYRDNTLWQDIVAHPSYDDFWKSRSPLPALHDVRAAVLVVGGWFDAEDLYGPLAVYRRLLAASPNANVHLVMGPWRHHGWDAQNVVHSVHGDIYFGDSLEIRFQQEVEAPFFRAHLKANGRDTLPGALIFDTGRKQWTRSARWPGTTRDTPYYFHTDGSFSTARPTETSASRSYVSDPMRPAPSRCKGRTIEDFTLLSYMSGDQRCFDNRPDVLTFQSPPLTDDVTWSGEITADLAVSSTGSDADYVVKVIDVYPGNAPNSPYQPDQKIRMAGYQQLVRGEIMRARFRDGFSSPRPMTPNEITRVPVRLQDVLHTFKKGHRIMVQVQSSWFPAFDRNPQTYVENIYRATAENFVKATETVWMDRQNASSVRVRAAR